MKKSKLHLSKETICRIENEVMSRAMGGWTGDDDEDSGDWLCGKETDPLYFDCDEVETNGCNPTWGCGSMGCHDSFYCGTVGYDCDDSWDGECGVDAEPDID